MLNNSFDILIIDDSQDDQDLYSRALEKCPSHYRILAVADGDAGIEQVRNKAFACVLLDYSLPGYNGIEVLKQIRQLRPFLPVVMLTGQGNEELAVNALHAGAQNYISKSAISSASLEQIIKAAMDYCAMQKRICEQQTSLEVFTRALAHDLKEPIRIISSFMEVILSKETFSNETQHYFQHMRKAANRMTMLMDTVHLYTRLDAGAIVSETCDLGTIIKEVKETLGLGQLKRSVVIEHAKLPLLYANRSQLVLIMQNLLANSVAHSDQAVLIQIKVESKDDGWQISVTDNGPGIPAIHLESIFEPFKRLTHVDSQHSGMGLAICRKIIESHGGRIGCQSELGKGTTIYFTLPNREEKKVTPPLLVPVPTPRSELMNASIPVSLLARVLLVDDNVADLELTKILLEEDKHLQCIFLCACDGDEALEILRNEAHKGVPVDLVLLDINMPRMTGFEMIEEMLHDQSICSTAVVMCSTSSYDKDIERSHTLGAAGYMTKPPDFDKLRSIIANVPTLEIRKHKNEYVLLRSTEVI